ncbi:hypothetical protein PT974_11493 [Cladobotryum mycophilum]|uniref:Uncharacterized protein n=1 Tax=Cladobotryum mycophilum TaxID=491253 RepID=A0ABR0S6Q9_9HYPO
MPRFSVAFAKRRSNTDETENVDVTPPVQPSFRVLERNDFVPGKSFDGGARMARATTALLPKPDFHVEDNMFADLKTNNRGSGLSNTTHATSTDNSSRHSNASTAPSSADFSGGNVQDETRFASSSKASSPEVPTRGPSNKSIGSKFLDRANRTFSFGGQKRHTIPPPREDYVPDLPPVLTLRSEHPQDGARGMTASTTSTATLEADAIDLGGDFGSMMPSFDKRASMATVRMDDLASPRVLAGNRPVQSNQVVPPSPDTATPADPLLSPWSTPKSSADQFGSNPDSPLFDRPPPVPPHQTPSKAKPSTRPSEAKPDEESKLLQETYSAIKLLSASDEYTNTSPPGRYRREEDSFTVIPRRQPPSNFASRKEIVEEEDNMFEGSTSRFARSTYRYATPKAANPPRNKVMTPAEFEKYREDKIRQDTVDKANHVAVKDDDDDEEINYDDEEDEAEKSKQQAKQRRKQEAHMAVYRQQMMKVTGETATPPVVQSGRPGLPSSMSAPQLSQMKGPSPLPTGASDEDEDEEVPLAILQAHGFPHKNRPPTRLSNMGSNPNMRASAHFPSASGRPPSIVGDSAARRHSTLPAFARNLPQDPFFGASIARPALRESLAFSDASQLPKPPSPLPPGGLVGVIASEERSRALRRGSPSVDATNLMGGGGGFHGAHGLDPVTGIPHHMMYNQPAMSGSISGPTMGPTPMPPRMMQQPMMSPGDHAQLNMTHQMSQFMQMQMQFMQMMAVNQGNGAPQQYPGMPGNGSMMDLSSRNSFVGEPAMDSRRTDYNMRTMSMVQPSSAPMVNPGYAGSVRSSVHGYSHSIAPSERSNIGLPNRYRPVSQAAAVADHGRSGSLSGVLSSLGDNKGKSAMRVVNKSASTSDDDDEEGWEAMKNKRDKKRSLWKSKKTLSSVI